MDEMEIKDKNYIQFPKFKINATLKLAVETMVDVINLPENRGRFKDGEGIIIDHLTDNGDAERSFFIVSGETYGNQSIAIVDGPDGNYVTREEYEELDARVTYIEENGGGYAGEGAQGEAGATGSQGNRGPRGPKGEIGPQGLNGERGPQGQVGAQGFRGEVGPQGEAGVQGSIGTLLIGPRGENGPQGAAGVQGPAGVAGSQGNRGEQGKQGNQGTQGTVGAMGSQGAVGISGSQGNRGTRGDQGALGTKGVDGAVGSQGNRGYQGPQGSAGPQGDTGIKSLITGNRGANGPQGAAGVQGPAGIVLVGTRGETGPQGAPGVQGSAGLLGSVGTAGVVGQTGAIVNLTTAGAATGYILGKSDQSTGWNGTIYISNAYFVEGALYESSDERWKTFRGDINVDLDEMKSIPKKYYTWNNDGSHAVQIGTSAQELAKQYPEIVNKNDEGYLSVAYDRLSVIALAAIDKLNDEIKALRKTINQLSEK